MSHSSAKVGFHTQQHWKICIWGHADSLISTLTLTKIFLCAPCFAHQKLHLTTKPEATQNIKIEYKSYLNENREESKPQNKLISSLSVFTFASPKDHLCSLTLCDYSDPEVELHLAPSYPKYLLSSHHTYVWYLKWLPKEPPDQIAAVGTRAELYRSRNLHVARIILRHEDDRGNPCGVTPDDPLLLHAGNRWRV